MNQITVESNVVELETSEQLLASLQTEDAITELNFAQLALIGGGEGIIVV